MKYSLSKTINSIFHVYSQLPQFLLQFDVEDFNGQLLSSSGFRPNWTIIKLSLYKTMNELHHIFYNTDLIEII
jgi:hypothetical protein